MGIVQLIGQAIRKRKLTKPRDNIVAIGVTNYGSVKNIQEFRRSKHLERLHEQQDEHPSLEQDPSVR